MKLRVSSLPTQFHKLQEQFSKVLKRLELLQAGFQEMPILFKSG